MKRFQKNEQKFISKNGSIITWKNLSIYVIDCHRKVCKQIVNNVKGILKPGELTGILGGSGSGKSSLMSALACRTTTTLTVQGDIRVNGYLIEPSYMRQHSGYMYQDEIFIGCMTVVEHLWFTARMKLDHVFDANEINLRIQALLLDVGLSSCCNTKIGSVDTKKILSGGEKKRLALATELLTDPSILFLDEPTTGQDACTATILVHQLQLFANQGHTVLCTIHQPSSIVFNSFHKIILVSDGRIAFSGSKKQAIKFFSNLGYICPHSYNEADFLVGILASNVDSRNRKTTERICDAFLSTDESKEIDLFLQLQLFISESVQEKWRSTGDKLEKTFFYCKLKWMIHRGFIQVLRDPVVQHLRIIQKLCIGMIAGLCFFGTTELDQMGIQAIQGVIFILVSENTFFPMYSTLSVIPQDLPLFLREYNAGLYSVKLYYVARIISLFPGFIIEPIIFTSIVYWISGLSNSMAAFGTSICIILLTMNVSTACGFFFSVAFENLSVAMAYLVPFDYLLMITMGSFVQLSSIPVYMYWIKYISWLLHSTEALSIIQWYNVNNISCSASDFTCITEGNQVLLQYGFIVENFYLDICLMMILYFLFHLIGYICLLKKCK